MKNILCNIIKILLPFVIGIGILWWMYRGSDWDAFFNAVLHQMNWGWMLLSLVFGVLPQVFRALRWRIALAPLGERPSCRVCCDAIFLSYAASLVIPRVGEVTRCGTLKNYAGTSFTKSLGTVVTERLVDSVLLIILAVLSFFSQLPVLMRFMAETGTSFGQILGRFTSAGYLVTIFCIILIFAVGIWMLFKMKAFERGRHFIQDLWQGIASLRHSQQYMAYMLLSLGIWMGYFLHFYIAFFCFDFTSNISPLAAFLIFCVGSFAVIVPTPNGAGPWHFAVKTMLVLYGVAEQPAILFVLAVHTIQTALVVLLGAYGWADLLIAKRTRQTLK